MAGETADMKLARESAEQRSNSNIQVVGEWPYYDGIPMVKISCAASELVATRQYSNVTVGPTQITFFASADGEILFDLEGIRKAIGKGQEVCEGAVADERQTIQALIQASLNGPRQ